MSGDAVAAVSAVRQSRPARLLLGLLVFAAAAPFALNLAGDAQVHLAIAEAFADGRPFQYNPGGELVVASTSPFWTMLLALLYRLAGDWTPALLSAVAVVFWLSSGYVLYRAARDLWHFRGAALWGVALLWLAHTTIVANALGGLENVAAALQVLLIYYVIGMGNHRRGDRRPPTADRSPRADDGLNTGHWPLATDPYLRYAFIGLLLGWALLTRPDGGLFALGLVVLGLPVLLPTAVLPSPNPARGAGDLPSPKPSHREGDSAAPSPFGRGLGRGAATPATRHSSLIPLAIIPLVATAVLLPWFAYQYATTGRLLTDSSVARLYNGRMGSLMLIPDLLYLHPKPLLSLASAFLPLAAGFLVFAGPLALAFARARGGRLAFYRARWPQVAALLLVAAGFIFYTAVVGAEAFGRYFLPLFPFFFLAGADGLRLVYDRLASRGYQTAATLLVILSILFLTGTATLDYYRRLGPGRFAPQTALDVIRGPAERRYYAANAPFLVRAPARRAALTGEFLSDLGADGDHTTIAVTEVQLRYFLDDRVTVLSLDGRTSADILRYVDPISGVPDFGRYFADARPDYVHVRQWCAVGGWLAGLFPSRIRENLVCEWERRAAMMSPGDTFDWQGRTVTVVAPDIVRIDWNGS